MGEGTCAIYCSVEILPGENELESLAFGVLRVLRGENRPTSITSEGHKS